MEGGRRERGREGDNLHSFSITDSLQGTPYLRGRDRRRRISGGALTSAWRYIHTYIHTYIQSSLTDGQMFMRMGYITYMYMYIHSVVH